MSKIYSTSMIQSLKQIYDAKISVIETKYLSISGNNKYTDEMINVKIKGKQFVDKYNILGYIDQSNLDKEMEH